MRKRNCRLLLAAALAAAHLAGLGLARLAAQQGPPVLRVTLSEAKERALAHNKLLNLAGLNVEGKGYAVRAMQANYLPQVTGTAIYLHFNDDLGKVLSTEGRTITGPLGAPLVTFPPQTFQAAVLNQDSAMVNVNVIQPITDLLKVRQGVKIARADQQIAQAELEKGIRNMVSGVEQLYWGLLAARRIQAGAHEGLRGAQMLAKGKTLEARTALVEARQAVQQVDQQVADLQEQLNGLLDLPLCTVVELVEPPLPVLPVSCADDAVQLALSDSPEIRAAEQLVVKAEAAIAAGKLDFVPSIAVLGGYANQQMATYVQPNVGYVGVVGTYTFIDGGKRRNVIRERNTLAAMAHLKLAQTRDEIQQKVLKAYREVTASQEALTTAQEMVELRKEAEKVATTPEAMRNPTALLKAVKNRGLAEVDFVKADLAYRTACVKLMALLGNHCISPSLPAAPAQAVKDR
jgi:outer membrane protein